MLAIDWANAGSKAAQLILSLSLIVIVHEFGHYLPSKIFKCRVKIFFFRSLVCPHQKKIGETVYDSWLPLGGYVKISGMVDESMDKEQMKQPPQPWEFRSKPAWQRLIIMLGGVTMNVLLAFVIYAMILYTWGQRKILMASLPYGVQVSDSLMYNIGFRNGDKIQSVNGKEVVYFDDLPESILMGGGAHVDLIRDGQHQTIDLPETLIGKLVERKTQPGFISSADTGICYLVPDTSNAYKAGLKRFDQITAVSWHRHAFYENLKPSAHKNELVTLTVEERIDRFS